MFILILIYFLIINYYGPASLLLYCFARVVKELLLSRLFLPLGLVLFNIYFYYFFLFPFLYVSTFAPTFIPFPSDRVNLIYCELTIGLFIHNWLKVYALRGGFASSCAVELPLTHTNAPARKLYTGKGRRPRRPSQFGAPLVYTVHEPLGRYSLYTPPTPDCRSRCSK